MQLSRNIIQRMIGTTTGTSATGGGPTIDPYVLPVAADGTLGGIQIGYATSATNRYYAVQLDDQQRAYVNVPWTDHYAWGDITNKPSATGGSTTPVYWNGSGFTACTAYSQASVNYANSAGDADTVDGKHAAAFLQLAGGTMTGTLGLKSGAKGGPSGDHGLNCNNSDIVGVNSIYTNDTSSGWGEGIEFKRSDNNWDSLYALDGTWHFKANNGSGYAAISVSRCYSYGGVTALSDARKKDVLGDVELSVDDIARMPAVRFRWKDLDQAGTFIGTLAQSWSEILPEAVQPMGDNIGFDYNGAAIVAVVNLAKAVQKIIAKMDRYGFK